MIAVCRQCGEMREVPMEEACEPQYECMKCFAINHGRCPICQGTGGWSDDESDETCWECGGSGRVCDGKDRA